MVYVTGAGIANTMLGRPDIGLTTMTEMANQAALIADRVGIPVLADADTGFGGVANVQRTVRAYERAGVAGIHLEDQVFPKRCGHFDGKSVVPAEEIRTSSSSLVPTPVPWRASTGRSSGLATTSMRAPTRSSSRR
jgi:2-methylisocitrate lyase-like PEP mutase family enzyme